MTKLRVGYVVPEFPGQTHVFFWREIQELEKRGMEVNIVSTRKPLARLKVHEWTQAAEARTFYLHPLTPGSVRDVARLNPLRLARCLKLIAGATDLSLADRAKLPAYLPYALRLAAHAQRQGWQHLHAHFTFRAADIVLFASLLSGIPYSMSKHGPDWGVGNQFNKWRHAAFGTVITRRMLDEVRETFGDSLPADMRILAMGVELAKFTRRAPYVPYRGGGVLRLFCCGRIDPSKGHETALLTAAKLAKKGLKFELRIAGSVSPGFEAYQEGLNGLVREHALQEHVKFLGGISEREVISELEQAHAFVLASPAEPLGVVYMEAMAMELPTIGTDAGGVPELIADRQTGLLAKSEDPDSLAAAIEWVVEHPNEAVAMGKKARAFVTENYQSSKGAQTLFEAIEGAVQRARA